MRVIEPGRAVGWIRCLASLFLAALVGCAVHPGENPPSSESCKSGPGIFFVATNGNDQWSGTLAAPNWWRTDGPFATVQHSVEATRALAPDQRAAGAKIFIRRGTYFLSEPLVLKPEDSGLTLAGYLREKPVLSGGRLISGWKEVLLDGKKLWATDVPSVQEGTWNFVELWVNGERAVRARHPDKGYLKVAELPDKMPTWTQGQTRFRFQAGDLKDSPGITNAEVVVMNRWAESRLPITGVDEKERLVNFGKRSVFELAPGDLYYAEGAPGFLEKPGEWALDRGAGKVFYWPRPGEKLAKLEAIAPVLPQIIKIRKAY